MKLTSVVFAINLAVLLLYSVGFIFLINDSREAGLVYMVMMMFFIAGHYAILLIASVVFYLMKRNPWGNAFIISSFLIALIGFSVCLGGTEIVNRRAFDYRNVEYPEQLPMDTIGHDSSQLP